MMVVSLMATGLGSDGHGAGGGRNANNGADVRYLLGGKSNGNFAVVRGAAVYGDGLWSQTSLHSSPVFTTVNIQEALQGLSFFICKMGTIRVPTPRGKEQDWGCCESYTRRCVESSQQVLGPQEVPSKTVWKEIIMPIA